MDPIKPIREGDTDALDKMNRVIAEANKVEGKAETSALAAEILARQQAVGTEANIRAQAVAGLHDAMADQVQYLAERGRLGEVARAATASLDGAPQDMQPVIGSGAVSPSCGAVLALTDGRLAPRAVARIEPGRRYRLRVAMQRMIDPSDPAGNAITIGLNWLAADKSGLAVVAVEHILGITTAAGRVEFSYRIATVDDEVDAVAPAGAIYVRPFIRAYGDGLLHVELIAIEDLSLAADWSPDVSEFRRGLAGLDHRTTAAEQGLSALSDRVDGLVQLSERAAFAVVDDDADFGISALADARVVRHLALLTQTRQAVLIPGGAIAGSTVRITRPGGGAFPLDAGPGLRLITAGSWADFTFDGTAWFLAAAGTL